MAEWDHLIGKVFRRGGGKYPGHWIVIAVNPGGSCICLGVDDHGDVVGASNYQAYYVDRKVTVSTIDIEDIRFHDDRTKETDQAPCDRREKTSGVSPILHQEPASDGDTDRC